MYDPEQIRHQECFYLIPLVILHGIKLSRNINMLILKYDRFRMCRHPKK